MKTVKKHLWKKEYRNFLEISKMESISYDVLKKAFYRLQDIKKAVEYTKNTFSVKDYEKYEYNGKKYSLSNYCKILSEVTGYNTSTIKGRVKNKWSLDQIISTPVCQYRNEKRKEYNRKFGAEVKIYDLDDNLIYCCNTYAEAAEYLNAKVSNIVNTCYRSGIFQSKYKIRSKVSSEKQKELIKKKRKSKNNLWCKVSYLSKELDTLASERCKEITRKIYYAKNKASICEKVKHYYCVNKQVKLANGKVYYKSNKERSQFNTKKWIARNKEKYKEYHKNYRKNASDTLNDVYIKTTLATTLKLSVNQITPELINIKRKQLQVYRELKQIT
jgi:hypothetical protein